MKTCPRCQAIYPESYAICPRDSAPLVELGEWAEGTVIRGKFRILRKIGQGGMGAVYEALHLRFNERRALKVISTDVAGDPEFLKRFEREAILTRHLQHPNAVRVDDIEEAEDGRPYIVMELVEGQSLKHLIQEAGPLQAPRVCAIVQQVAAALEAAHQLGMVHRDIKPDNIVLLSTPAGEQAKVLDFGIAKLKEARLGDTHLTATGVVIGTPQYMSPEQALGKRGDELDGRSDLYSLGCVMYEMLTGTLPFAADTTLALLQAHAFQPPRSISEVRPDLQVPDSITRVVMHCLAKKREDRPASAQALITELERIEGGAKDQPPAAELTGTRKLEKASPTPQVRPAAPARAKESWMHRWSGGWRFLVVLASYMLVVAGVLSRGNVGWELCGITEAILGSLVAGGWYLLGHRRHWVLRGVGIIALIVVSLPTALLFLVGPNRLWGVADRTTIPSETPAVRTLRGHTSEVNSVAFSPNGKMLASGSEDGTVKLWDVRTGALQRTLTAEDMGGIAAVVFSTDGQTLVGGGWGERIGLWDVNTGELKKIIPAATYISALAISPDGRLLASGGHPADRPGDNLQLWEMPTGKARGFLKGHTSDVFSLAFSPDSSILASGSGDGTVKLWDPQSGTAKETLTGLSGRTPCVAFSPRGTPLAIVHLDYNGTIRLLDIPSGATRKIEADFTDSVAFSPDGRTVAASGPGEIELLDVASGALKRKLQGPSGDVLSLVFSPNGKLLASSGTLDEKDAQGQDRVGAVNLWPLE